MASLVEKALALVQQGHSLPARVRNRAEVLLDQGAEPLRLTPIEEPGFARGGFLSALGIDATPPDLASFAELEQDIERRMRTLRDTGFPFTDLHNGTATLAEFCYVVCKALNPAHVVETGVAYGVTSAYILRALSEQGAGKLHSIDLPPLARDSNSFVGHCVPSELRRRWDLRIGSARKLLPDLLREQTPDVFVHDSLHTYSHMKWELALALASIRPGGVLIADDIEGNRAFEEALHHPRAGAWVAIAQAGKKAICGAIRIKP